MPLSGKPTANSSSKASPSDAQAAKVSSVTAPVSAPSLQALKARYRKGISLVGTEERLERLPMRWATGLSAMLHVFGPIALTVITLLFLLIVSWLMHFNFWDLFKPQVKPDMQFTLVQDRNANRPDKPLFKGNHNQRAGGKQNKKKLIKAVDQPPQSSAAKKAQASKPQPTQQPQHQSQAVPETKPIPVKKPEPQKPPEKPAFVPTVSSGKKAAEAAPKQPQTQTPKPQAPSQAKSAANASVGTPATAGGGLTGSSSHSADMANPQDGKGADLGVDVAEDTDYGPFMADLEKRIKRNWLPPRHESSKKVVLMIFVARDGQVVKIDIQKSSGSKEADDAAIQSVHASAPFMAFPPKVKEDILPVEFAFDYNVLNPKNPKQALKW